MSTFKVRDLMVTVAPEGAEHCTALTGKDGGCRKGSNSFPVCVIGANTGYIGGIPELGSEELATLKQQLQVTLTQVAEREKALTDQAAAAGKSVEKLELEDLAPRLSGALEQVRIRLAGLK